MTPVTLSVMTPKGTTRRTIRIPDEVWEPAKEAAEARGESLSEVIRAALVRYTKRASKESR